MPSFCTRCGSRNDDHATFCENCGAPLGRRPAVPATAAAVLPSSPASAANGAGSRRLLAVAGVALAALAVAGGGLAVWLQPPKATPDRLLAAARSGWTKQELDSLKRQLCIGNTDYRTSPFNANPYDQRTQSWMDTLVTAGLYSAPVPVPGGMFTGTLMQYVPTPELAKHLDGSRLCVARGVEIAAVEDIGQPVERSGTDPLVGAQVVLRATDLATWMQQQPVRERVVAELSGWEWKDRALERRVPVSFALHERTWITGSAVQAQARAQPAAQRVAKAADDGGPSLLARLSSMLHFGGNPLQGTWRLDTGTFMGVEMPAGLTPNLTFTSDALEAGGARVAVKYEVQGKRVTVTTPGEAQSMVFLVDGQDTIVLEAAGLRYRRVR